MKVSVIVCTRNRSHAIVGCLESIAAALSHASPVDAEIVVVDNASEDDTSAVVKAWASSCSFPVQLLLEPKTGVSKAKNRAIRAAQGDLLVFTDDDCRLSETYVTDALRHDANESDLVLRGGRVELGDPTDLPLSIKTDRVLKRWNRQMHSAKGECLGNCIVGCNLMMRRALAERLGPFDERLGPGTRLPGGEDTDYIYRAYCDNITIAYVPDMLVFHHHGRKSRSDGQKLLHNYMLGTGALYAKYLFKDPNLCRQFYWDVKAALKERVSGNNTFMQDIGFSHIDKVRYCVVGAARYLSVVIRGRR